MPQEIVNLEQGEFYASIVDFSPSDFKAILKEVDYETIDIPAFTQVDDEAMRANYKRIKEEARMILAGALSKEKRASFPTSQKPESGATEFQPFKDL